MPQLPAAQPAQAGAAQRTQQLEKPGGALRQPLLRRSGGKCGRAAAAAARCDAAGGGCLVRVQLQSQLLVGTANLRGRKGGEQAPAQPQAERWAGAKGHAPDGSTGRLWRLLHGWREGDPDEAVRAREQAGRGARGTHVLRGGAALQAQQLVVVDGGGAGAQQPRGSGCRLPGGRLLLVQALLVVSPVCGGELREGKCGAGHDENEVRAALWSWEASVRPGVTHRTKAHGRRSAGVLARRGHGPWVLGTAAPHPCALPALGFTREQTGRRSAHPRGCERCLQCRCCVRVTAQLRQQRGQARVSLRKVRVERCGAAAVGNSLQQGTAARQIARCQARHWRLKPRGSLIAHFHGRPGVWGTNRWCVATPAVRAWHTRQGRSSARQSRGATPGPSTARLQVLHVTRFDRKEAAGQAPTWARCFRCWCAAARLDSSTAAMVGDRPVAAGTAQAGRDLASDAPATRACGPAPSRPREGCRQRHRCCVHVASHASHAVQNTASQPPTRSVPAQPDACPRPLGLQGTCNATPQHPHPWAPCLPAPPNTSSLLRLPRLP